MRVLALERDRPRPRPLGAGIIYFSLHLQVSLPRVSFFMTRDLPKVTSTPHGRAQTTCTTEEGKIPVYGKESTHVRGQLIMDTDFFNLTSNSYTVYDLAM